MDAAEINKAGYWQGLHHRVYNKEKSALSVDPRKNLCIKDSHEAQTVVAIWLCGSLKQWDKNMNLPLYSRSLVFAVGVLCSTKA